MSTIPNSPIIPAVPIPMVLIPNNVDDMEQNQEIWNLNEFRYNRELGEISGRSLSGLIRYMKNNHTDVPRLLDSDMLVGALEELAIIRGNDELKTVIVDQVFNMMTGDIDANNLHSVITGASGETKIILSVILTQIWTSFGYVMNDAGSPLRIISRHDIIGKYFGHSHLKTQRCLSESPGVLFIEEADFFNTDCRFGMEALDAINRYMEDHSRPIIITDHDLIYPPSLSRKFTHHFRLNDDPDIIDEDNDSDEIIQPNEWFGLFD